MAAYDEAEAECRLALDRVELAAATPEATDVLLTLAEVRTALGDADGARQVYRWAADAARAQGDGARLGLAATGLGAGSGVGVPMRLMVVDHERVEWLETALALLAGVEEPAPDGPTAGVPIEAVRTRFLSHLAVAVYDDDLPRAVAISKDALAASEQLDDPTYRSAALIARRMALWCPDSDIGERVAVGAEAVRTADAGGDLLYRIVARLAHLSDLMEAADLDRFDVVLAEADDLCRPLHQARWDWLCDMSGVSGLLLRGRYAEADEVIAAAVTGVGEAQGTMPLHVEMSCRIVLERDLGRLDRSVERLRRVEAIAPRPIYDAAAGFARALSGDLDGAADLLRPHAEVGLADVPRDHLWTMTVAWYGETAHVLGDVATAALVAGALAGREDRMLCMGGLVAAGLVGRVRGLVLATAGDLDGAVATLEEALAGHRRLALRPWVARTARRAGPRPARARRPGRRRPRRRPDRRGRGAGGLPGHGPPHRAGRTGPPGPVGSSPVAGVTDPTETCTPCRRRRSPSPTSPAPVCASGPSSARTTPSARTRPSPSTATWPSSRPWTASATTSCGWASTTPAGSRSSAAPKSSSPPPPSAPGTPGSARASWRWRTTTPCGWRSGSCCSTTSRGAGSMLGLGPGGIPTDGLMVGVAPEDTRELLAEGVRCITALLRGESVTSDTPMWRLRDARLHLRPYSEELEVCVSVVASPTGAALAGTHGLGMLSIGATQPAGFEALASHWSVVEQAATRSGATVDRRRWRLAGLLHIAETREQAERDVAFGIESWFRYYQSIVAVPQVDLGTASTVGEMISYIRESGLGVIGTPDDAIEPGPAARRPGGWVRDLPGLPPRVGQPAGHLRSHELLAQRVMPHFQGHRAAGEDAARRARLGPDRPDGPGPGRPRGGGGPAPRRLTRWPRRPAMPVRRRAWSTASWPSASPPSRPRP